MIKEFVKFVTLDVQNVLQFIIIVTLVLKIQAEVENQNVLVVPDNMTHVEQIHLLIQHLKMKELEPPLLKNKPDVQRQTVKIVHTNVKHVLIMKFVLYVLNPEKETIVYVQMENMMMQHLNHVKYVTILV